MVLISVNPFKMFYFIKCKNIPKTQCNEQLIMFSDESKIN